MNTICRHVPRPPETRVFHQVGGKHHHFDAIHLTLDTHRRRTRCAGHLRVVDAHWVACRLCGGKTRNSNAELWRIDALKTILSDQTQRFTYTNTMFPSPPSSPVTEYDETCQSKLEQAELVYHLRGRQMTIETCWDPTLRSKFKAHLADKAFFAESIETGDFNEADVERVDRLLDADDMATTRAVQAALSISCLPDVPCPTHLLSWDVCPTPVYMDPGTKPMCAQPLMPQVGAIYQVIGYTERLTKGKNRSNGWVLHLRRHGEDHVELYEARKRCWDYCRCGIPGGYCGVCHSGTPLSHASFTAPVVLKVLSVSSHGPRCALIKATDWAYYTDPEQLPVAKPDPHGTLEVKEVAPIPRKRKNHDALRHESGCKRANTGLLVRTSTDSVYLVSSGAVGGFRGKISPIAA